MADDGIIGRFPARLLPGNGVNITYADGVFTVGVDPGKLMVTPTDAGAPVALGDLLAMFLAQYSGARNIINISDGSWDFPGSGNGYSISDGSF